jgi:Protein of unknown function (DUF3619)
MIDKRKTTADDFGKQLADVLHARVDQLEPTVEARLRAARQAAVQAALEKQPVPETSLQPAMAGGTRGSGGLGRWSLMIPAALLLVGLTALSHSQWLQQTLGLADRDAAVLKDSLPPNAYGDPGFNEYLDEKKTETETPPPDEEEAKP